MHAATVNYCIIAQVATCSMKMAWHHIGYKKLESLEDTQRKIYFQSTKEPFSGNFLTLLMAGLTVLFLALRR